MKFVKRRIAVPVMFATSDGVLETLEGPVHYSAGDALLTGSAGEHWPIRRKTFEATYDPVLPILMGENGPYMKKLIPVEAFQTTEAATIVLDNERGELHAMPGDWIVTAPDGKRWIVADTIFRSTYVGFSEA